MKAISFTAEENGKPLLSALSVLVIFFTASAFATTGESGGGNMVARADNLEPVGNETAILAPLNATRTLEPVKPSDELVVIASVNIYSGRPAPQWKMTAEEVNALKGRLSDLPPANQIEMPDWGYISVMNRNANQKFPYYSVYSYAGTLLITDLKGEMRYYADDNDVHGWLASLGDSHDPYFNPPVYLSLPKDTPYIAVYPLSFDVKAALNAPLKKTLTVFSEGTGKLEGKISVPRFINLDKKTFNLAPVNGIESFVLEIDTKNPGEKSGEIVIESNDPKNNVIRIPVRVSVIGAYAETGLEQEKTPAPRRDAFSEYGPYLLALIVLAVAGLLVFRRKT